MKFTKYLILGLIWITGTELAAQDTIDVTFRFNPSENAVRSFVPGSFNNWGNNSSGQISPTDGSLLTVDEQYGFSYQVIELEVGGGEFSYEGSPGYTYKFHEHYNQSGTSFEWFTDPLNPIAIGQFNDSFIEITHPLIFQIEPADNSIHQALPPGLRANVAALEEDPIDLQNSEIYVNGDYAGNFEGYYEADRQLLLISSIGDLGVELLDGTNELSIVAVTNEGETREASSTFSFISEPDVIEEPRPSGMEDGITYYDDDPGKVSFSVYAPGKEFIYLIGDHSNWEINDDYLMKMDAPRADSIHFWITLEDLNPGEIYRFQYLVDAEIRVADPFSELVLDPDFDQYITSDIYPDMPEYPHAQTNEIVGIFEPGKAAYQWDVPDFERPEKEDLVIYELLLRDFVEHSTFETLTDTLDYLENLGVNAIELMPVSQFDGNISWGYNPVFHGALDKSYGTRDSFKAFVDEAHKRGIAVILDVVYNHAHDKSPLIRLFGTSQETNPLLGPGHAYNVFFHLNHDHPYIQYWLDRMNRYWLETYNVDGYRFDLTKGFASNVNSSSLLDGYNSERIANLKRMADKMWEADPEAYIILEHFAANSEEVELSNYGYGMMLWGNHNHNYNQASMGYTDGSDFSGIHFTNRGWSQPHLIGYMESHDEQWLMLKNRKFGNNSGGYDIRNLRTALDRQKLVGAFFLTIPGPKMIWQFGELGYGYGEHECLKPGDGSNGDCLSSDPGRTSPKPIRWEYYEDPDRYNLYRNWSELLRLRKSHPAFSSADTDFSSSLSGRTKWIKLEHPGMDAVIFGNFDVQNREMNIDFTQSGTWYDFFTGDEYEFTEIGQSFDLLPGQYKIMTTQYFEPPEEDLTTDIEEGAGSDLPNTVKLYQNYPNPFNPATQIKYDLPEAVPVTIEVYNMIGQKVSILSDRRMHQAGTYTVTFDGSSLGSGIYVLRLTTGDQIQIRKMTLIK